MTEKNLSQEKKHNFKNKDKKNNGHNNNKKTK